MEKKVAAIWVLGILCATVTVFGVLWFAPFQDSEVKGDVSARIHIGNVTIPLQDLLRGQQESPSAPPLLRVSDGSENRGDVLIGDLEIEAEVHASGKNLEKLIRGVLPFVSSPYTYSYRVDLDFEPVIYAVALGLGAGFGILIHREYLLAKKEEEQKNG